MKKKLLPLAIAAAMTPGFASAAEVSGFADIIYTIDDSAADVNGGTNPNNGKFTADGEIDFTASPADGVTARIDLDVSIAPLTGASDTDNDGNLDSAGDDSASIEQAFFAWGATEGVTVIGGVFNNPIGYEAEDAPDMDFTTHGHVYDTLDGQTALDGDNIAGVAVAGAVGPATVTLAVLNDLGQVDEENSIAAVVNFAPVEGLDLELGYVTQQDDRNDDGIIDAAGNVANFNVVYSGVENLTVGLDYLAPAEIVDSSYDLWAGYSIDAAVIKARYSSTEIDGADDASTSTTLYLGYQIASNLSVALELRNDDDGTDSTDLTQVEFIATF